MPSLDRLEATKSVLDSHVVRVLDLDDRFTTVEDRILWVTEEHMARYTTANVTINPSGVKICVAKRIQEGSRVHVELEWWGRTLYLFFWHVIELTN